MDAARKEHGNNLNAVKAAIDQCLLENVLSDFLSGRREEVQTIMTNLFDEETIMRNHDYEVEQRGIEKGIRVLVETLQSVSQSRDTVIRMVSEKFGLQPQVASDKVAQYWV